MSILCIGKMTYDVFCPIDGNLELGKKHLNNERIESGGGEISNAAFLLGKWGLKPSVAGVVGSDDFGAKIKKELESVQVDTSLIETSYEKPTILSFILINKNQGISTIIRSYKTDFATLRKQDLGMAPDIILADGHEYSATHLMLERNPKSTSIIFAEENKPEIIELCKFSKYVLCSKEFAESITGMFCDFSKPTSLVNLYQTLKNRFPSNEIVVTLKNMGALYSMNDEIKIMPGINANVVDLSGAGDAFKGAFVYGLINKFPIDKAIQYANIAAGLTIQKMGIRNAIPALSDVINYYNQKFPSQFSAEVPNNGGVIPAQNINPSQNVTEFPNVSAPSINQVPSQQSNVSEAINSQSNNVQRPMSSQETVSQGRFINQVPNQAIPSVMPEIPKN